MNQTEFHQVPLKKMAPIALFNDIHNCIYCEPYNSVTNSLINLKLEI